MKIVTHRFRTRQRGFTLVEAIVVMVITGILSGIMVLFIRQPVKNYADAAGRADMSDTADLALRRMSRELHSALPNSIRVTVSGGVSLLEFIPTYAGGQYVAVEDNVSGGSLTAAPLSFTSTSALTFSISGPVPAAPYAIRSGDYVVVYNLGPGFQDADAYAGTNMALVDTTAIDATTGGTTVTIKNINPSTPAINPFAVPAAAGRVPNASPGHRFQLARQPVTFRCQNNASGQGTLTRYWNYSFLPAQTDPATLVGNPLYSGLQSAMMANNVLACDFSVSQPANQRSGLVGLTIALARSNQGGAANNLETLTLADQVHVDNTP
ncbi:type II secretion system protein [Duganella hordei]|uniref:type II secretion system protein n=1 Tax=Duganella hordei TaxID=2865934 RepID=UPI0030E9E60B